MNENVTDENTAAAPRRLTTVLAADVCGYSRLAEQDEDAALRTVERVFDIFENTVAARRGRIFHRAGDGFMAEFPSAADGVMAALEFKKNLLARDTFSPNNTGAEIRCGVHSGDVVENHDRNLMGHGVNVAARLQSEASPGGILVSLHTVNLVRGQIDVRFKRRGPMALKNIDEPVVAFDVSDGSPKKHFQLARKIKVSSPLQTSLVLILCIGVFWLIYAQRGQNDQVAASIASSSIEEQSQSISESIVKQSKKRDPSYQAAIQRTVSMLLRADNDLYKAAIRNLSDGDLAAAVAELRIALSKQNNGAASQADLALTQRGIATLLFHIDPKTALTEFEILHREYRQSDAETLNLLGGLYLTAKSDPVQARAMFIAVKNADDVSQQAIFQSEMGLGKSFWYLEDYEASERHLQRALAIAQKNELEVEESSALASLGSLNILAENFPEAEKYRRSALAMERARRDDFAIGKSLNMLGVIASEQGNYTTAINFFEEALEIRTRLDDIKGVASVNTNLGDAYLQNGNYEAAKAAYWRALEISEAQGIPNLIGLGHQGLAMTTARIGNVDCACAHIAAAEVAYSQSPNDLATETITLMLDLNCPAQIAADDSAQCKPGI